MSYIRVSTKVRRANRDKRFDAISGTYAWSDVDGYIYITNAISRGGGRVSLTPAEMRHMCRNFARKTRLKI